MASGYDGSVRVKATVDDSPAKKQLEELREKLVKQTEAVDKQADAVNRLKEQYKQLSEGTVQPKGVRKMESDLKKAQSEAAKLDEEFQRLSAMAELDRNVHGAVDPETEKELGELSRRMAEADSRADALNRELEKIRLNPAASEEARKLEANIQDAEKKLAGLAAAAANTKAQIGDIGAQSTRKFSELGSKLKELSRRLRDGIAGGVKKAGNAVDSLKSKVTGLGRSKGFEKAGKSAERFGNRLKSIVAGALFFNIISKGLSALTKQIGNYLIADKQFASALSGIKSNLLTAFQPIYEAVLPALTAMMEGLRAVTAQIASFMASIFGTTAKQAQENADALYDQANATAEAGKEAKKAERFLASFDTIEKIGKEDTESGENSITPGFDTDFSEIQPPQWLTDFWKVFQDSWDQYGASTIQFFKDALSQIGELLSAIGASFMQIWTGGQGLAFLNLIQQLLQVILGIIGDIAAAFTAAWNSGAGEAALAALSYMLNSILAFLVSIGQSFRAAWNDGSGERILSTILDIIRNIFDIVGNLASRFREAWEENDNGVAIWDAILDVIEIVLDTIKQITDATLKWAEKLNLAPLVSSVRDVLESIRPVVKIIGQTLGDIWENTVLPFLSWLIEEALPWLLQKLSDVFTFLGQQPGLIENLIKIVGAFIAAWEFGKVISAIGNLVSSLSPLKIALAALGTLVLSVISKFNQMTGLEKFGSIFGIIAVAAGTLAVVIAYLTGSVVGVIAGVAAITAGVWAAVSAISSASKARRGISGGGFTGGGGFGGGGGSYRIAADTYPHLADGAVISPNNEFLAVLGDQRSGMNIETPLSTMKQAFKEAMSEMGGWGGATSVNVTFEGSLSQLARLLEPKISVESARKGTSLVTGGVF